MQHARRLVDDDLAVDELDIWFVVRLKQA